MIAPYENSRGRLDEFANARIKEAGFRGILCGRRAAHRVVWLALEELLSMRVSGTLAMLSLLPDSTKAIESELRERVKTRYRESYGFNPLIILAIIQIVITLIKWWKDRKNQTELDYLVGAVTLARADEALARR